jgi:hypothetical protein
MTIAISISRQRKDFPSVLRWLAVFLFAVSCEVRKKGTDRLSIDQIGLRNLPIHGGVRGGGTGKENPHCWNCSSSGVG